MNLHKENSLKLEILSNRLIKPSHSELIDISNEIRHRENEIKCIHRKIKKIKKKSEFCIICNRFDVKLQLANIDHKYSLDVKDYIWLCPSCHSLFDRFKGLRKLTEDYEFDIEFCKEFEIGYLEFRKIKNRRVFLDYNFHLKNSWHSILKKISTILQYIPDNLKKYITKSDLTQQELFKIYYGLKDKYFLILNVNCIIYKKCDLNKRCYFHYDDIFDDNLDIIDVSNIDFNNTPPYFNPICESFEIDYSNNDLELLEKNGKILNIFSIRLYK